MRIGINGLLLGGEGGYRRTGVSRYIESLVRELPAAMPEDELVLFAARGGQAVEGARGIESPFGVERPPVRIAWEATGLPVLARRHRLDLFHGTVNALPPLLATPAVVTIHDLAFLRWPEQVPSGRHRYLAWAVRSAVRRARRVLAVSESTKADVVEVLGVDPDAVAVTPLGVEARFRPGSSGEIDAFRRSHRLERPFLLAVGTLEPRKNVPALLEAFAAVRERVPHDLLLVGPEGWLTGPLHATLQRLRLGERVRLTGYVPNEHLPDWYRAADALLFPSLYEGFGLPVLEAMACATPVLSSNVSSLPEVAGDAALLVDPRDVDAIAAGIERIVADQGLRRSLMERGPARAARFTWRRTAEFTAAAYREAVR